MTPNEDTKPDKAYEQGKCQRGSWYAGPGKALRAEGWRLKRELPNWSNDYALIERVGGEHETDSHPSCPTCSETAIIMANFAILYDDTEFGIWLCTHHKPLGNSPLWCIRHGRLDDVVAAMDQVASGAFI